MTPAPPRRRFTEEELRIVDALRTPRDVQRWLSSLPYNREEGGQTARSFRGVVRAGTAHCLEAALAAATVLEQHGYPPTLLDLESWDGLDHVLFLYREGGRWGTVAKSRDPGLHGRKPVFRSLPDLVETYLDPYVDLTGRITGYGVLDLRELPRGDWRLTTRNLRYVEEALRELPHKRYGMTDARYRRVAAAYKRFKERWPERKPAAYPWKETWMGWPPPRGFALAGRARGAGRRGTGGPSPARRSRDR